MRRRLHDKEYQSPSSTRTDHIMKASFFALLALAVLAFAVAADELPDNLPPQCQYPIDSGSTCEGYEVVQAYGYDVTQLQCRSFSYNGCDGNINRFTTLALCKKTCESPA